MDCPHSSFVILNTVLKLPLAVAFSASSARSSRWFLLSFLALFFTSLSFTAYSFCVCSFNLDDLVLRTSSLNFALSSIAFHVFDVNFCLLLLFRKPMIFCDLIHLFDDFPNLFSIWNCLQFDQDPLLLEIYF